ncbi:MULTISPECIES: MATE family efflux transporter [unclassified Fibrobacter]|uniref:MATE family efflux transporter n=1 Tax=unclassified Fibrobacter TaxID=2634177 RepID=UPI000D6B157C|nr:MULTISPECIES: MATE family efflux transporter [unclassified Fibrobacter]PWJ64959.1 putative MATE family efflux protein [Fibrobacter sp. UWR4]PZW69024.1 putative MATE family efflux protein [Fibrobacter sp. UWR1]
MPRNLYEGNILRNIGLFSVPFLIANFLQTLYGMADLFIIGQFTDAAGITAVAVGSQVMHFVTVILVGLTMGTTVLMGQAVGAKRHKSLSRILGNTALIFTGVAILFTAILLLTAPQIVSLLSTPAEAVAGTTRYLVVCFLGIPFITAYNVVAAAFRGLGDTKSPMYFVTISCVVNIALDFLFVGPLGMGPAGAAVATVLSQLFCVVLTLASIKWVKRVRFNIPLSLKDFRPNKAILWSLTKIGFPIACQEGFIQVSFLFITLIANSRGLEIAAAVGVVEKIICFLFLVPSAMLSSVSAISAQCIGADRYDRARQTLYCGMGIAAGFGLACGILFQFISEPVLALFTDDLKVITYGTQYLHAYVFDCMVAGIHFCFSGYFCACGRSVVSFIHNAISIVTLRVPGAYLAAIWYPDTLFPMGIATLSGSFLSVLICVGVYLFQLEIRKKPEIQAN